MNSVVLADVPFGTYTSYLVPKQLPLEQNAAADKSDFYLSMKNIVDVATTDSVGVTFESLMQYKTDNLNCKATVVSTSGKNIAIASHHNDWAHGFKFFASEVIPTGSSISVHCDGFKLAENKGLEKVPYVCNFRDDKNDGALTMSAHYEDHSFSLDNHPLFFLSTVAFAKETTNSVATVTSSLARSWSKTDGIEFEIEGDLINESVELTIGDTVHTVAITDITPEPHTGHMVLHHTTPNRYSISIADQTASIGAAEDLVSLKFSFAPEHANVEIQPLVVAGAKHGFNLNLKHTPLAESAIDAEKVSALFIKFDANKEVTKLDLHGLLDTINHKFPSASDIDCLGYVASKKSDDHTPHHVELMEYNVKHDGHDHDDNASVSYDNVTIRCVGFSGKASGVAADLNKAGVSIRTEVNKTLGSGNVSFNFGTLPKVCGVKYEEHPTPANLFTMISSPFVPKHHTDSTIYTCSKECGALCPSKRPCHMDGDCQSSACNAENHVCEDKASDASTFVAFSVLAASALASLALIF